MDKTKLTQPAMIKTILGIGIIAILLFPPATFEPTSQEWWLPAILVVMAVIGIIQILRKSSAPWPLYLVGFSQGFNIISRLLMFMPQSTHEVNGAMQVNGLYLVLTIISMAVSGIILWYLELPQVKQQLAH
jgi:hypothetical protein